MAMSFVLHGARLYYLRIHSYHYGNRYWQVICLPQVFLDLYQSFTVFFRYKVIVYSANNRTPQKASTAFMTVLAIWTLSIMLSFPLFLGTNLNVIPMPDAVMKVIQDDSIAYCVEKWGEYEKGRLVYTCFILVMQVCHHHQNQIILYSYVNSNISVHFAHCLDQLGASCHQTKVTKTSLLEQKSRKFHHQTPILLQTWISSGIGRISSKWNLKTF